MRRIALALALIATPAAAQQYWLPNGPGGTTYNNPQGSLTGTYYEHELRRQADRYRWQRERQATGGVAPSAPAQRGGDPSFRLNNTGGRVVREVYVSSATDNAWGTDRLGQGVLRPGERLIVSLPPGQCVNDVRVVFMDGQSHERRRVDTCALTDLSVQ